MTILQPWDHDRMFTDKPWLVGSCGRETVHAEITIVDDDGNELPGGEVGEIRIVGETTATGYWNRPEETAATFRPDGLYSGDVGRLDDEGYLYVVSRKTDMIISGGFNVYPAEIERVIGGHPDVDLVAVIGVADPEWGETPVATIVPKAGVNNDELEASLRAAVPGRPGRLQAAAPLRVPYGDAARPGREDPQARAEGSVRRE